jgi:hypothetical protein
MHTRLAADADTSANAGGYGTNQPLAVDPEQGFTNLGTAARKKDVQTCKPFGLNHFELTPLVKDTQCRKQPCQYVIPAIILVGGCFASYFLPHALLENNTNTGLEREDITLMAMTPGFKDSLNLTLAAYRVIAGAVSLSKNNNHRRPGRGTLGFLRILLHTLPTATLPACLLTVIADPLALNMFNSIETQLFWYWATFAFTTLCDLAATPYLFNHSPFSEREKLKKHAVCTLPQKTDPSQGPAEIATLNLYGILLPWAALSWAVWRLSVAEAEEGLDLGKYLCLARCVVIGLGLMLAPNFSALIDGIYHCKKRRHHSQSCTQGFVMAAQLADKTRSVLSIAGLCALMLTVDTYNGWASETLQEHFMAVCMTIAGLLTIGVYLEHGISAGYSEQPSNHLQHSLLTQELTPTAYNKADVCRSRSQSVSSTDSSNSVKPELPARMINGEDPQPAGHPAKDKEGKHSSDGMMRI